MATESKNPEKKILFLCFHNSARSQMAEGLPRAIQPDRYEVHSAGVSATRVDPHAERVKAEIGIDIPGQRSKGMDELRDILFDLAVNVCDRAREACLVCSVGLQAPPTAPTAKETCTRTSTTLLLRGARSRVSSTPSGDRGIR